MSEAAEVHMAVPYLRVSTHDKGQNPQRQLDLIKQWAGREHVTLLKEYVDEGTSATKTNPFQRPVFVKACETGEMAGADGIVVEIVDRFCGQGCDEFGWAKVEMRGRYGLQLYTADTPLEMHGTLGGNVMAAAKAEVRREWAALHSQRIKSGIATRRRAGKTFGGAPPKPLTDEEVDLALRLYVPPGKGRFGWRKIAREINRRRGVFELVDKQMQRRIGVSHNHVKRLVEPLMFRNHTVQELCEEEML